MLILKILGIALAVIALLIIIILLLPARILILFDENFELSLYLKILGYPLVAEYPGKEKKEKGLAKEISDSLLKATGASKLTDTEKLRETLSHGGLSETVGEELRIIISLLREVVRFLPKCVIKKLKVDAVLSEEDPAEEAMDYGLVCAVVYPLIGFIESFIRFSKRAMQVNVRCSFGKEKPKAVVEVVIGTKVFRLAEILVRLIIEETKNAIRQEGLN